MDRAVIATAAELLEGRHFPGVIAICADALEAEPECVPLLVLRARAHIALRRGLDAQRDLREIVRLDPRCAIAYRLLGELAARRDENAAAAGFLREALRLAPDDRAAADWLQIVEAAAQPREPARAELSLSAALEGAELDDLDDADDADDRAMVDPGDAEAPRFARGTQAPVERPTQPFTGSLRPPAAAPVAVYPTPTPTPLPAPSPVPTLTGRPTPTPPARQAPRMSPRPVGRGGLPELPGFGDYLVAQGILTRERLRAAQAYQRSMKVQLATAIVTLGLASPQRIEWAVVAHQSQQRP